MPEGTLANLKPPTPAHSMKSGILSVVYLVIAAVVPLSMRADATSVESVPSITDLRTGGREAVREWIAERAMTGRIGTTRDEREFRASVELAVWIYNESGGDLVVDAIAEAEDRISSAMDAETDRAKRARLAAVLGKLYQSLQGDAVRARLWYENALRLDPDDEMAREGLQKLAIADAVSERKQREKERLVELERAMDRPVASP